MSRPYAEVIGDPIAHSRSPLIHAFWLDRLGLPGDYRACRVTAAGLDRYLDERRADPAWRGCNVTIPHKEAMARLVDTLDPRVAAVGAVNTIVRASDGALTGMNTDVDGIGEAIAGVDLARPVVVLGAGGAARAAFAYLAARGAGAARVIARDPAKAGRAVAACGLAARVVPFEAVSDAFDDAALLINATQLGMTGQSALPGWVLADLVRLAPDARVFDMVYAPLDTALLRAARALGLTRVDGLTMLIGQAATAFAQFFGEAPPRESDAELRALLTA